MDREQTNGDAAIALALLRLAACDSAADASGAHDAAKGGIDPELTLCSGCPSETRDTADRSIRVHHVHLNVQDARETIDFYAKYFQTKEVLLNDASHAIWADPILLLLEEVDREFPEALETGLEHVGFGTRDPVRWAAEMSQHGLTIDTRNGAPAEPASCRRFQAEAHSSIRRSTRSHTCTCAGPIESASRSGRASETFDTSTS